MYAITSNPIDLIIITLMVVCVCAYVCVRHYMYVRSTRTMVWSPMRDDLRAMRRHL